MAYSEDDPSSSLVMKLMHVAREHETRVKADRQRLEGQLVQSYSRNAELERQAKADAEKIDNLTKMVQTLQVEVEKSAGSTDERVRCADFELMRSRFDLFERTSQLIEVMNLLLKIDTSALTGRSSGAGAMIASTSENVSPDGPAPTPKPMDYDTLLQRCPSFGKWNSMSEAFATLNTSKRTLNALSKESFFAAVADGAVADMDRILRPSMGLKESQSQEKKGVDAAALPIDVADMLQSSLLIAAAHDRPTVCRKLLQVGATISKRSDDGLYMTPLHVAASLGHESIVKLFIGKDCPEIDCKDAYERTPLHWAARNNHASTAKLLLLNGADPTAVDIHSDTPLQVALGINKSTVTEKDHPYIHSGELDANEPAPSAQKVLEDPNVLFWNASLRANKYYADKRFEKAISAYSLALEMAPKCQVPATARDLATLHYNRARARYRLGEHCAAIDDCSAALAHDPSYRNALAQRAECHMSLFDFERAAKDFQSLLDTDPADLQWTRRLMDARNMRDMSHYGILNVRKDADAGVIKKAYRALCLRWHPDKHSASPEDVARAHTAFRRINNAYEVLSDSYKKMMYDLDPKSTLGMPSDGYARAETSDGFDKWYARELDREAEREKERAAARAVESSIDVPDAEKRKAARQFRLQRIAALLKTKQPEKSGPAGIREAKGGVFTRMAAAAASSRSSSPDPTGSAHRPLSADRVVPGEPLNAGMNDDEVAAQVVATAARARAAVAQAEAFVKLVHAHSAAASAVSSLRPQTADEKRRQEQTQQAFQQEEVDYAIPGALPSIHQDERAQEDEDDVDEAAYRAYLDQLGQGLDDLEDDDDDVVEDDFEADDGNDGNVSVYSDGSTLSAGQQLPTNSKEKPGLGRIPSLAELEAELEGLTAEALAAATAARDRHAS